MNGWIRAAGAFAVVSALTATPLRAQETTEALISRIEGAEPALLSYRANVEFSVGLHSFPYLRKTIHGDAFFKRPDRMEVVFSDLPGYARAFRNVYVGLGTPAEWQRKYVLTTAETTTDGRAETYLVMTPKRADRRLKEVDVYLEERSSLPERIVWRYRDGAIEMHQQLADVDGHRVVSAQDADIRVPGVHAYVRTRVTNYAFNVPVDDAVFTKKKTAEQQ